MDMAQPALDKLCLLIQGSNDKIAIFVGLDARPLRGACQCRPARLRNGSQISVRSGSRRGSRRKRPNYRSAEIDINLAVFTTGPDYRILLEQQDDLTKLAMAAIVKDLNAERQAYQTALNDIPTA